MYKITAYNDKGEVIAQTENLSDPYDAAMEIETDPVYDDASKIVIEKVK